MDYELTCEFIVYKEVRKRYLDTTTSETKRLTSNYCAFFKLENIQENRFKALMKEKDRKEVARKDELAKKTSQSMSQEESVKEVEERKKLEKLLKDTMKKVGLEKSQGEDEEGKSMETMKIGKKKQNGKKRKPNCKERSCEKEARPGKATREATKARPQGGEQFQRLQMSMDAF